MTGSMRWTAVVASLSQSSLIYVCILAVLLSSRYSKKRGIVWLSACFVLVAVQVTNNFQPLLELRSVCECLCGLLNYEYLM